MNRTAVFSKTGKGLLEIKNKSNRLSREQSRVLNLVDGKATLADLADKARVSEVELRKILVALSEGGYIKEFGTPGGSEMGGTTVPPSTSYVDDLDFTQILGPGNKPPKPGFYQSAATEQRQREEAERKASEAAAARTREEAEKRSKEEASRRSQAEDQARRIREEAERKAKEEQERREKMAADLRAKAESERKAREDAERKAKEEIERRTRIDAEVRVRMEQERKAREEALRKQREDEERRRKEEEERKRREEVERKRKEEEDRNRREEAERKRREEEERKRKEEEERKRREQDERRRKEEEEQRRREEAERKRREEEERKRKEEEERKRKEEAERKRREEEERKRKEEEERKRREEEERKRKEEEERKRKEEEERKRREEEERKRKEEEERRRREEEERKRREEEERRRKEEEARRRREEEERQKRELEEKHRREAEELARRLEEQRRRSEEDERRRRYDSEYGPPDAEERRRRDEDDRRREEEDRRREAEDLKHEEEDRKENARKRDEEERRREEEDRRREEEGRKREEDRRGRDEVRRTREAESIAPLVEEIELTSTGAFPALDRFTAPARPPGPALSKDFDADLAVLQSAEEQIEHELRDKEAEIRKQLEEQERRFRMEEEARAAMDRAERDAREKSDREARELAIAAEQARRDAEQRAREEAVRRAQEEKERRHKEQDERRKQAEEERKRRERERREAEQRAREEELQRRRQNQEERDRRKSDIERMQREARKRAFGPGKIAAAVVVALAGVVIGVVEVAPISAYAPNIEKLASERIGEPVRIDAIHASLFPGFHLSLDGVTVGQQQDVRVNRVTVYMSPTALFGDEQDISKLVVEEPAIPQEALARVSTWLRGNPNASSPVTLRRLVIKTAKLDMKNMNLPSFDADLLLTPDRTVLRALIESNDGHFSADVSPGEQGINVEARGRNFSPPFGPSIELTDFTARGVANGDELKLNEVEFSLYGGQGKGAMRVAWGGDWSADGTFELQRLELDPAMKALKADIPSEGSVDAKGRFFLQAPTINTLLNSARIESSFIVRKGNLSGLDLVRALQSPTRDGVTGGKTKFEELSGTLIFANDRYQYSGVKLKAGAMTATGQGDVAPNKETSGRVYVELRSSANTVRGNFRVTGNLKGIVLRP